MRSPGYNAWQVQQPATVCWGRFLFDTVGNYLCGLQNRDIACHLDIASKWPPFHPVKAKQQISDKHVFGPKLFLVLVALLLNWEEHVALPEQRTLLPDISWIHILLMLILLILLHSIVCDRIIVVIIFSSFPFLFQPANSGQIDLPHVSNVGQMTPPQKKKLCYVSLPITTLPQLYITLWQENLLQTFVNQTNVINIREVILMQNNLFLLLTDRFRRSFLYKTSFRSYVQYRSKHFITSRT